MSTPVQHASPAEPSARLLVPTLALATFVTMTSAFGLGPFLPVIAQEFGTPVALLGQVPAGMLLLAALLGLVIGPLADHFGYRRVLVTGLLTVVASALATGFAPDFPLLLLVTLIGAVGRAAVLPVAQAFVATRYQEDNARRRALSWINMGVSSSLILGLPLLGPGLGPGAGRRARRPGARPGRLGRRRPLRARPDAGGSRPRLAISPA